MLSPAAACPPLQARAAAAAAAGAWEAELVILTLFVHGYG